MKKSFFVVFCILFIFISGCSSVNVLPTSAVVFKNQTLLNSGQATVTVIYARDKRIENKYTDIYVKSDKNNLVLQLGKEFGELKEITIKNLGEWYSLTNLFAEHMPLLTFEDMKLTTFVIKSNSSAKLTFKALGGDMVYHINTGESELINRFPVSKEFDVTLY